MKNAARQVFRLAIVAFSVVAAIYALNLARAAVLFNENTPVSVAAAVRLQPNNSDYLDRLATWESDDRKALLQRAIAENPFDYDAWMRLGFIAEMEEGDIPAAEKCYQEAARVNHMFLPRWTLTNFYFRQQRKADFFHWSRETLAVTPYSSEPVFAQMWQVTQDEDTLENAIPNVPRILLQYAWYLNNNKQYNSVSRVVERLVHLVNKNEASKWGRDDLLAATLDNMISSGYLKQGINLWAELKNAGWIEQTIPNDQSPLTNGSFRLPTFRHGFDWVLIDNPGTHVEQIPEGPEMRIGFYGDEPERLTLLQQFIAAAAGAHYTMTWQVEGEELGDLGGIAWHLHAPGKANEPELVSGDLMGKNKTWDFTTPVGANAFLLTLEYVRALGTVRTRGSFALKSVTMSQK